MRQRVRAIQQRQLPDTLVLLTTGILVGAVTFMLGAGFAAVGVAAVAGMVVHRLA